MSKASSMRGQKLAVSKGKSSLDLDFSMNRTAKAGLSILTYGFMQEVSEIHCETAAKGTDLEKSAGKEDPVELDTSLSL
ncbi:hypothetical protein JTE90_008135 [Oedothorax gibbosus]|uniref:Uncharacterized protein n=1 Tax=Oedothorax gibbosus TaxID=931172 RepID=A0AAV6TJT9_9ARAC|nr:hypothetical protein JTE90_008135 [Oedothorax gibbosus]